MGFIMLNDDCDRLVHNIIWPMFIIAQLKRMQYMHMSEIDSDIIHMILIGCYNVNLICCVFG